MRIESMSSSLQADTYPYLFEHSRHRWDPFLAALPHLWMGACIILGLLDGKVLTDLPAETLDSISDILLVILLATGLIIAVYAARNEHPLWTASWSGYTILALAAVPGRMISVQNDENWVYGMGFMLLAGLAILIGYFFRFRRHPLHAFLMVLVYLLVAPLFFLDSIPYAVEALFALFLSVLAASLAAFTTITRQWGFSAVIALVSSLLVGLVMLWINSNLHTPEGVVSAGLLMTAGIFLTFSLLSISILFGPWLFWSAADSARRNLA